MRELDINGYDNYTVNLIRNDHPPRSREREELLLSELSGLVEDAAPNTGVPADQRMLGNAISAMNLPEPVRRRASSRRSHPDQLWIQCR